MMPILPLALAIVGLSAPTSTPDSGQDQDQARPPAVWAAIPTDSATSGAAPIAVTPTVATTPTTAATSAGTRGEILVAPLPMINPTLENGLLIVAGYIYGESADDRGTPPSVSMGGGFKTTNGSWGVLAAQTLHLHHDRIRLLGAVGYAKVDYAYFGVGGEAGSSGLSIPLIQRGPVGLGEALAGVGRQWFVGARYIAMRMQVDVGQTSGAAGLPAPPATDVRLRTAGLGPHVERDTRDNPFFPARGMRLDALALFYGNAIGGRRDYQSYQASASTYVRLGSHQVLAWRLSGCDTSGDVPFFDLCQLGADKDVRGYVAGQFRDRVMVASQAEYRTDVWWRLGASAFIGAGEVAPGFSALTWNSALPGAGAGLRFTIARRNHVNLRADYAWGRDSHAFYLTIGEAF